MENWNWRVKFNKYAVGDKVNHGNQVGTIVTQYNSDKWFTRIPGEDKNWIYCVYVKNDTTGETGWINVEDIKYG